MAFKFFTIFEKCFVREICERIFQPFGILRFGVDFHVFSMFTNVLDSTSKMAIY